MAKTKEKQVAVVVSLNQRQYELFQKLDPVYGDDVSERMHAVAIMFLHENAQTIRGLDD